MVPVCLPSFFPLALIFYFRHPSFVLFLLTQLVLFLLHSFVFLPLPSRHLSVFTHLCITIKMMPWPGVAIATR